MHESKRAGEMRLKTGGQEQKSKRARTGVQESRRGRTGEKETKSRRARTGKQK